MLNSTTIEVAIGMALVFLLLSLICTAINEVFAGLLSTRAKSLESGIESLFTKAAIKAKDEKGNPVSKTLTAALYEHGLIQSLYRSGTGLALEITSKNATLPSYIPSRTFASALFDLLFADADSTPTAPERMKEMLAAIAGLPESKAQDALTTLVRQAGGDAVKTRSALEGWYNDAMDRVSGLYKRRTQAALFGLGLLLAVGLNINAIAVARTLWTTPAARAYTIAAAEQFAKGGDGKPPSPDASAQLSTLQSLSLPLGWDPLHFPWNNPPVPAAAGKGAMEPGAFSPLALAATLLGWLLTAMAVTLGAPFWFDLLNQFMVVRSTIKPSEKSQPEASKDPSPAVSAITLPQANAAQTVAGTQ